MKHQLFWRKTPVNKNPPLFTPSKSDFLMNTGEESAGACAGHMCKNATGGKSGGIIELKKWIEDQILQKASFIENEEHRNTFIAEQMAAWLTSPGGGVTDNATIR